MPWDRGGPPTLLIRYEAGGELARCTPPRSHLGCFQHPSKSLETRRGTWGLPTAPWPGSQELPRFICSPVPRCAGTWAPAELASPSPEQIQSNCPAPRQGKDGEEGVQVASRLRGRRGHGQLGTGTQMVLPESRRSDHRVMGQER